MKKIKQLICATIIFFGLCINTTALDKLSDNEMGDVVGQSGIDLTIPGCEFKISFDQFAINDDKGYVVANGPLEYIKIMDATIPILNELSEIEENKYQAGDTYYSLSSFKNEVDYIETMYDKEYKTSNLDNIVKGYVEQVKNSLEEHGLVFHTYTFTDSTRNILSNAGLSETEINNLHYEYSVGLNWHFELEGKKEDREFDSKEKAGSYVYNAIEEKINKLQYNVEKQAYLSRVIDSCFRKSAPLEATFAQYILGSKEGGIDFGSGRTFKDIDEYIDNKYGENNYTTPSFKPLSIDVVKDTDKGKYIHLGLPTMQLMAKDLSNMSLGISNSANISLYPLLTINVPGLVFEGHGGSVNLYPHTDGGFNIEFDDTKFYYFNQSMVIGDSSWNGVLYPETEKEEDKKDPKNDLHNIRFNDFLIHKGDMDDNRNRLSSFYHPFELNGRLSFDIETELDGKTWLKIESLKGVTKINDENEIEEIFPDFSLSAYATMGQMKICGVDFGTLEAGQFHIGDFKLWISSHSNTGFDAKLSLALESDELKYTYDDGEDDGESGYNNAVGLHLSNSFTTTTVTGGDSNKKTWHQEDGEPSKWQFSGTFNLGGPVTIKDWDSPVDGIKDPHSYTIDQPLTIDIESDKIIATTTIDGSLGIENVQLGGKDFGPVLATGIKAWARITLNNY